MELKCLIQFPIFAPLNPTHRPVTEVRFSRWNSVTCSDRFIRQDHTQEQIEDELRHLKGFDSADKTINIHDNASTTTANETLESTRTLSPPSPSSVTGNKSNYSNTHRNVHPAFHRMPKVIRIPTDAEMAETNVRVSEDGVSYILPNAPFAYRYSYTETPKVKPKSLREPPMAPFGSSTMPRPWTGRKPLPSGKKVDFDSFRLPPAGKKGVKPVQALSQFLQGSGPKYVKSREEVLGEPLTKEEVVEMVIGCKKIRRQLNMGRDGLTHNMLDNIHAFWKRKTVCKIKCKGVCTVDMDNVRRQLEEKTGGKIIYSRAGIIYLFRGRNYNYKTRPHIPLMLWKPVTPVYPKLIKRAPKGLTLEEASEMRNKGRKLIPICRLGKNGVYCNLVKNVSEAFEACELVRINCEGMNPSDYRKIGGKLKDLVPCVLISFEREHILMWRGRDWKSSLPPYIGQTVTATSVPKSDGIMSLKTLGSRNSSSLGSEIVEVVGAEGTSVEAGDKLPELNGMSSPVSRSVSDSIMRTTVSDNDEATTVSLGDDIGPVSVNFEKPLSVIPPEMLQNLDEPSSLPSSPWTEGVLVALWKEAIECGKAAVLDHFSLDADIVYRRAVALSQCAPPPGPVFSRGHRKVAVQKLKEPKTEMVSEKGGSE